MNRRGRAAAVAGLGALAASLLLPAAARADMATRVAVSTDEPNVRQTRLARGRFLVANRTLRDPSFAETVILLVDYNLDGALGVVVNRPTDVPLTMALPEVEELRTRKDLVFLGGPVARDRMVILLRSRATPPESVKVFDQVYATGSVSALLENIDHNEPVRAYAGYAGWGPGQLDAEVARGDWLIGPADSKAIFDDPPRDMWSRFLERFTGDWANLPRPSGPLLAALAQYP